MAINYTYKRPWLYPKQHDAIFCPERFAAIEASTKSGKTFGCMAWLLEQALIHGVPGRNYWWIAPILAQAKIPFKRIQRGLPQGLCQANLSEMTLAFPNGATIWFKGSDNPDSLYGEDVYAAVMDECTRAKEEAWHALRSTLTATQGMARLIGNVNGRRNWAYLQARRAEAGELGWHYAKIIAYDAVEAGILAADEIASAQRDLPEAVFRELYLAEPSDDTGNPFGLSAIRECIAPLSDGEIVCWGIDLAKSQDWTVLIGLDIVGHVVRFERWQGPWNMTIDRIQAIVGGIQALVDSTGVGDAILERLQQTGGNYQGYVFTFQSKQRLMEGLAAAIQRHEIEYPDGLIVDELESFGYEYSRTGVRYVAPEGLWDDCVCALALGVQARGMVREFDTGGFVGAANYRIGGF